MVNSDMATLINAQNLQPLWTLNVSRVVRYSVGWMWHFRVPATEYPGILLFKCLPHRSPLCAPVRVVLLVPYVMCRVPGAASERRSPKLGFFLLCLL